LKPVRIDFVSDIACPWCAVGLASLEQALNEVGTEVSAELQFQPFELNPQMPPGGQDVFEHLTEKYGTTITQVKANQEKIYQRAAQLGFPFHPEGRKRVYNTFNAHRLLHWAMVEFDLNAQHRLKKELHDQLLEAVKRAQLPIERARDVLDSEEFVKDVKDQEQKYHQLGVNSVPSIILNNKFIIQGAQSPQYFAEALRDCANGVI
jgi:predicted DsbA family dithiol-disulfide isomerase